MIGRKFNIPIRAHDLACLQSRDEKIGDEVMNFFLQIYQRDCHAASGSDAAVYFMNSFFYTTLCGAAHNKFQFDKVSAWIKVCVPRSAAAAHSHRMTTY